MYNRFSSRKFIVTVGMFLVLETIATVLVFYGKLDGNQWATFNNWLALTLPGLYGAGNVLDKKEQPNAGS